MVTGLMAATAAVLVVVPVAVREASCSSGTGPNGSGDNGSGKAVVLSCVKCNGGSSGGGTHAAVVFRQEWKWEAVWARGVIIDNSAALATPATPATPAPPATPATPAAPATPATPGRCGHGLWLVRLKWLQVAASVSPLCRRGLT